MATTAKQIKEFIKKEIESTKETLLGFSLNEGYEWEIATLEGEINGMENILRWIERKER